MKWPPVDSQTPSIRPFFNDLVLITARMCPAHLVTYILVYLTISDTKIGLCHYLRPLSASFTKRDNISFGIMRAHITL